MPYACGQGQQELASVSADLHLHIFGNDPARQKVGVEGDSRAVRKLKKFFTATCLVDQEYVKEDKMTVAQYLASVAKEGPQKEGMMTQYWQLDAEPVESMDYWDESERYLKEKN